MKTLVLWFGAILSTVLWSGAVSAQTPRPQRPVVTIAQGALVGRADAFGVRSFKGIPYATPPVGDRRWTAPTPAAGWSGPRDAGDFGASCMQPPWPADSVYADHPPKLSEDCLYLNVWAPAHARKAPVIVWIHGGGLVFGSSWEPYYDGKNFARRGVVFVSINYRLGVFGWMANKELSAESPHGSSGDYGLLDQIEALKWVKANIAAFGGDPDNVTIDGESAGGLSVALLLASPVAKGLFHKAIGESLGIYSDPELKVADHGFPSAEQAGEDFRQKLGAADLKAMRAVDARTLQLASFKAGYRSVPTVDGWVLPRQLVDTFDRREESIVPVIVGFNRGEIETLQALLPPTPASSEVYAAEIRKRYGDLAPEFLRLYPADDPKASMMAAVRDAIFGWGAERIVRDEAAAGAPSYLYFWDHEYPAATARGLHAFHASEIPFVFGLVGPDAPPTENWPRAEGPQEEALANAMISYWVSFAKTGRPTAPGAPDWPRYVPGRGYLHVTDRPVASHDLMPGMFTLNEEVMQRRRRAGDQQWGGNVGVAAPLPPAPFKP